MYDKVDECSLFFSLLTLHYFCYFSCCWWWWWTIYFQCALLSFVSAVKKKFFCSYKIHTKQQKKKQIVVKWTNPHTKTYTHTLTNLQSICFVYLFPLLTHKFLIPFFHIFFLSFFLIWILCLVNIFFIFIHRT